MVAEGPLERAVARVDETLHQDLGAGGRVQSGQRAAPDAGAGAAQQAGEFVLRQRIGHRRHGREHRRRIGADRHQHREGFAGMRGAEIGEIQRAAAVRQPAHDHPVAVDHLLAVDRDVLAWLAGAARHHQAERDQAADVAGPAALDRQRVQVDGVAFEHDLVEGRIRHHARRHVRELGQFRPARQRLAQARGPARFLQRRQQLAQFAQRRQRAAVQRQFDAVAVPEQIAQQGMPGAARLRHQQCRPAAHQRQPAQRGAFQVGVHRRGDLAKLAARRQRRQETAQVVVAHGAAMPSGPRRRSSAGASAMPCAASQSASNRVSA